MSQSESAVTSSSGSKRAYRKGNPLTGAEKQRISVSRKKKTHKAINVFIRNDLKDVFLQLCQQYGVTQAEMIEGWIENETSVRTRNEE